MDREPEHEHTQAMAAHNLAADRLARAVGLARVAGVSQERVREVVEQELSDFENELGDE